MVYQKWRSPYEGLSKRAVEILRLLATGMSDREIAERLVMTVNTVKWYNRQIYSILGVGSRTKAIARAGELNILNANLAAASSDPDLRVGPRHSLPVETTRFVGRKNELEVIRRLLESTHLLTLVGPPGTGKTRLAQQIASEMLGRFKDGVFFISLGPISDPALVTNTIASIVGVTEAHGQPLLESLKLALRDSHMLLVLDNFEHLLPAAMHVSELLSTAPHLTVLTTSREPLHLYGEREYSVPPLELPDPEHIDLEALAHCESVALFLQRARAVRPDFALSADNGSDIAKICVRLEGLPLAIELAAARIKLLTPRTLLARLASRLDTLTGGAHDLPARQQALHNTIEWSYNLLSEGEKILFARLSAFEGGRSLEAIEAVCSEDMPIDVFHGLTSLVNKSLIQQRESQNGEPRFFMLETIYEYAWARLGESGEAKTILKRHAEFFVRLVETVAPALRQAGFSETMSLLETEENNLRAVLKRSFENGEVELGLRLVAALRDFWVMSGRFIQAENWTQLALSKSSDAEPHIRVGVLTAAGLILYYSSEQRALQKQLLEEAIKMARSIGDDLNLGWSLIFLASASVGKGDEYEEALRKSEEGLSIFRKLGHKPGMAQALNNIGELTRIYGDDERAKAVYEECLLLVRESGEVRREGMMLFNMGFLAMHRGDVAEAEELFRQGISRRLELGYDKPGTIADMIILAGAIAAKGELERAARLFGAGDALLNAMGSRLEPGDQPEHDRHLADLRSQLDAPTFDICWNEGRALSFEQMVQLALDPDGPQAL